MVAPLEATIACWRRVGGYGVVAFVRSHCKAWHIPGRCNPTTAHHAAHTDTNHSAGNQGGDACSSFGDVVKGKGSVARYADEARLEAPKSVNGSMAELICPAAEGRRTIRVPEVNF